MQQPIKMRWHEAYKVILLILGILRSVSLLGVIGEYAQYKFSSVYLTDYLKDVFLWWLLAIVFDLVTIVFIFTSYAKLKHFAPGAIGTHTTMLVLLAVGSGVRVALEQFLLGNSMLVGFLTGTAVFLPIMIPLWIYYHKRRRLYECSVAEREYLLYGTPMPEYKPRVLENNTFRTYSQPQSPAQLPQAAQPPVSQPPVQAAQPPVQESKNQVVKVYKKGQSQAAPKQPAQPQDVQPPIQPQSPQQQILFCRHCGCKLVPDAIYCTQCGAKIQTEEKSC